MSTFPSPTLQNVTVNGTTTVLDSAGVSQPITQGQLASTATGKGSALVAFIQRITNAIGTFVENKLGWSLDLFDFMTAAQIASVQARDLTQDVTVPVQNAVTAAIASGRKLRARAGIYKLTNAINVTGTLTMVGDGILRDTSTAPTVGTAFACTFLPSVNADVFYITGSSATFRDLEVYCTYQPAAGTGWAPTTTPTAFHAYRAPLGATGGNAPLFENVMVRGMTHGVFCEGTNGCNVNGLYGETFGPLLKLDGIYDVARINNFAYWIYYSGDTNIKAWVLSNVNAMELGRVDNPNFSNIFAYGVYKGAEFLDSAGTINPAGGVSLSQWTNVGFDQVWYGYHFNSATYAHQADVANLYVNCQNPAAGTTTTGTRCIYNAGTQPVELKLSNFDLGGAQLEAIRLNVSGSTLIANGLKINLFNQLNNATKFPAVYVDAGAIFHSGPYRIDTTGTFSAPIFGGSGTIDIADGRQCVATNPGYESYTAVIGGLPKTVYRQFGRVAVTITASGYTNWSVTLPVALNGGVLNARASFGSLIAAGMVDIFDGTTIPSTTAVAAGVIYTSTTGTVYVDWEVVGY